MKDASIIFRIFVAFLLFGFSSQDLFSQSSADPDGQIVAHRIRCSIIPATGDFTCTDTLTIHRMRSSASGFRVRLHPLARVSSVMINGKTVEWSRGEDYVMPGDVPSDTLFDMVFTYVSTWSSGTEFSRIGQDYAVLRAEEVLPTGPGPLRFVRMAITVPRDWMTIALGRQMNTDSTGNQITVHWQSDDTISTIGWICAGRYLCTGDAQGGLPVSVCNFPDDTAGARDIIPFVRDILGFYASRLTPYRFPKLSIVEIDDWVAGSGVLAIASPSCILVKKTAFTTQDRFNQVRSILPHEIAHQWWALTVFPAEDALSFLSEGMCEAYSGYYNAARNSRTMRDSLGIHPLLRPLLLRTRQNDGIRLHERIDLRSQPVLYLKGAYVHHMLEKIIGDSCTRMLQRDLAREFTHRTVTIADYQVLAESVSGKKLGWFFDQWLDGTMLPQLKCYAVTSDRAPDGWVTRGRIRISGYDKFTFPVSVAAYTASGGQTSTDVWLGIDAEGKYRNDLPFEVRTGTRPDSVVVDPGSDLLKQQKLPAKFSDLRDPSEAVMITGTEKNGPALLALARRDSMAMGKGGWQVRIIPDSVATLGDLQNNRVICYGKETENRVMIQLRGKFPLGPVGNTIEVNGEVISDSSLSFSQIIDNPFSENGLLAWIAPLGSSADPSLLPYNASWVLTRKTDVIASGIWDSVDRDLSVIPARKR